MQTVRVRDKHQITLPMPIVRASGVRENDRLTVNYKNGAIVFTAEVRAPAQRKSIMDYAGIGRTVWVSTHEQSMKNIQNLRQENDKNGSAVEGHILSITDVYLGDPAFETCRADEHLWDATLSVGLNHEPNAETVKTMIECDAGIGLRRFASSEALFAELNRAVANEQGNQTDLLHQIDADNEHFEKTGLHVTAAEVRAWMEAVKTDPTAPRPVPHL